MPEGPEIRLAADAVQDAIAGKPTTKVWFAFDHLGQAAHELTGHTVTAVETYGKAMLTRFDNGLNIYSHNQLYGVWQIADSGVYPDTKRSLRIEIRTADKMALLYSASEIEVLGDEEIANHRFIKKIGPDLLRPEVNVPVTQARFHDKKFARKKLTSLLLDQGFLAGLGNYLRSEILFVAGVHPDKRPMDCTPEQLDALGAAAYNLTQRSYATRGLTADDETIKRGKAMELSYRQYRWYVFNREELPCFTCGTEILKIEAGSRRLYYCPVCQAE